MTTPELLSRLEGVRSRGTGKWWARCPAPAHQDNSPSLSIGEGADRILLYCFALCETRDIVAALGLTMADLFFNAPTPYGHRPSPKPVKIDLVALAFCFELGALDRRLRAERIIEAGKQLDVSSLTVDELDRALSLVYRTREDCERAMLFENVADGLRFKAERTRTHEPSRAA